MTRQFTQSQSFFDIGLDQKVNKAAFTTLYSTLGGATKKRTQRNRLVLRLLRGEFLSEQETAIARKVLSGEVFTKDKSVHCRLCSDRFDRIPMLRTSERFTRWEVCRPTHPYSPGGLMLYLKDRRVRMIEDFQDLDRLDVIELFGVAEYLLSKMQRCKDVEVVGINVLFQQISKSQACIHGHIEPMIRDSHEVGIGQSLKMVRPFDRFASAVNEETKKDSAQVVSTREGLRIPALGLSSIDTILSLTGEYQNHISELVSLGREIQEKVKVGFPLKKELAELAAKGISSKEAEVLALQLSPAPILYAYFTLYRGCFSWSLIPEVALDRVSPCQITSEEADIYSINVNNHAINPSYILLRQEHPLIRPSFKLTRANDLSVEEMAKALFDAAEGGD